MNQDISEQVFAEMGRLYFQLQQAIKTIGQLQQQNEKPNKKDEPE